MKLPGESWESFAERKIRAAQQEGAFDHLPGLGQPIPGIDEPLDENWWIKQKMRSERLSLLPPILEARLEKERTLASLTKLTSESEVRRRLVVLNERIRQAHYSPAPGPADGICPVDIEAAVLEWRANRHVVKH